MQTSARYMIAARDDDEMKDTETVCSSRQLQAEGDETGVAEEIS